MNTSRWCSAYQLGAGLCDNGFPKNAACSGTTCHSCGAPTAKVPACMNEEVAPHLIDEAGMPRFARFDALAARVNPVSIDALQVEA